MPQSLDAGVGDENEKLDLLARRTEPEGDELQAQPASEPVNIKGGRIGGVVSNPPIDI